MVMSPREAEPDEPVNIYSKVYLVLLAVALLVVVLGWFGTFGGCSTLAQYAETQVPDLFEPTNLVLEDDHALLEYRYCIEGVCVDRVSEFTRFEMTTADGKTIKCLGIYQEFGWPDKSENKWAWPGAESDLQCEAEMQRLRREPED